MRPGECYSFTQLKAPGIYSFANAAFRLFPRANRGIAAAMIRVRDVFGDPDRFGANADWNYNFL